MNKKTISSMPKRNILSRMFFKWSKENTKSQALAGAGGTESLRKNMTVTNTSAEDEKIVSTCGTLDCGGRCQIKAHIKDGVITRISTRTDDELDPYAPVMKACQRGRSYRKMQYHPDRLKYPMKRIGKRGEGKFERISWDDATDIIAKEMIRITEKYGPHSRYVHLGTGVIGGVLYGADFARRLFSLTGGQVVWYHSVSRGNSVAATPYTYGTVMSGSSLDTLEYSKLIVLWGHNPAETVFANQSLYFQKLKKNGTKFIVVDPRYSDSAVAYADEWVPILPTTDNALMDAMAHVILTENLYDKKFLDTYCLGFDEEHMPEGIQDGESLVSYLLGKKDGTPKTPEWAEKICKAPANKIRQLAREYASAKPAALIQGWGPQRHACGERTVRGGTMLACITGNVGILGGWASGYGGIELKFPKSIPIPDNPVSAQIPITAFLDAITNAKGIRDSDGLKGTDQLDSNIKLIFNLAGNYLANQNCDINKTVKVLEDERLVEFIVVSDLFLTPSAKYADILLPANTFFEQWNLGKNWHWGDYFILSEKVVENYFESRVDYEWLADVAKKLGVGEQFTEGRDELGWVKYLLEETRKEDPSVPKFEELQKTRIHRWRHVEPRVAFQKEIEDPENYPFKTPSGKIELFSKTLYEMKDPEIPALPIYVPSWEGPEDALAQKYPLQLIGWKSKQRANSCFSNHPWLNEVAQSKMWINPIDAQNRKLKNGEKVKVFNDRGALVVDIEVTHRIIPGVVAIPAGAWWSPDKNGVDQNGCINVLTTTRKTALAHGNAHHTNLVQVEKL